MLSITTITAGQASRYYSRDNYYSRTEGRWQGKGAEALGLSGDATKESFHNLIHGKGPEGAVLVSYEPRNVNGRLQEPRAGIDLTFSAPKSVSILSEVLGDARVREAHEKAVAAALSFVEKHYAQARKTDSGITEKVDTGNLVIAKFIHATSRELDPSLHTHAVVMNITRRPDGSFRALSNEKLFDNKMLIGLAYRSELAVNVRELGYQVKTDDKGLFEVEGVDQKLIDHFSRRSEQIEQKMKELQESGLYKNAGDQRLREIACLGSRVAKRDVDLEQVRQTWMDRVREQGFTKEGILEATRKAGEKARADELTRTELRPSRYEYIRQASRIVTEQESVFSKEDVLKAVGRLSLGEYRIPDLEKAFLDIVHTREVVTFDKKQGIYTTKEMQRIEHRIVQLARDRNTGPVTTREYAGQELKWYERQQQKSNPGFKLTKGQLAAAEHILSTTGPALVQGDAGTGKTAVLDAVREIVEKQGYEVKGLSFTGKAAEEIQKASGIQSQTLHSFLAQEVKITDNRQLWIIDEASMVGSRQLHALLKAAGKAKAKIALIGDTKQLQAIEAGKMFHKLQEGGIKAVEMTETLRQKDPEYKDVVKDISARKIDTAFEKLKEKSRIHENTDPRELKAGLVTEYVSRRGYKDNIIVTTLNKDRREINQAVRDGLKAMGKLKGSEYQFTTRESKGLNPEERHYAQNYRSGDIITVNKSGIGIKVGAEARISGVDSQNHRIIIQTGKGERTINLKRHGDKISAYEERQTSLLKGDKIVFLKNDKSMGVQNGLTGTVKDLSENGNVTVRMGSGRDASFNLNTEYNYVDHGYAVTDFKAQGQTSQEVFYHADTRDGKNTYNSFYVAITRGKENVHIYTDSAERLMEQVKHEQEKSSTLDYAQEHAGPEKMNPTEKSIDSQTGYVQPEKPEDEREKSKAKELGMEL